jgi:ADP-heptose:LPS heptosyltransferase
MGKLIIPGNSLVRRHLIAPQKGVLDSLRFVRQLQKYRYDAVIDFMSTPRSAMLARLVKAKRRISFASGRKHFFTDVVPRDGVPDYIVREKFRLLTPLDIQSDDVRLMLPWDDGDAGASKIFMSESEKLLRSKRRVMLSPTHRRSERKWSSEAWAELAQWLEQTQNAAVVWAWGPGEEEEVKAIMKLARGAGVMAPKTSFRELAALTAACDLFIGNSNGPSHVAVAVNTPSIQLHGPTSAVSWSPLTNRHRGIQQETMQNISVASVKTEIESIWSVVDQGALELRKSGSICCSEDVWRVRPSI